MGDCVGQLVYGFELTKEEHDKLCVAKNKWSLTFNPEIKGVYPLLELECPYETEDHLMIVESTNVSSYNCAMRLTDDEMKVPDEGKQQLEAFKKAYGFEDKKSSWFLVGHYN
jgi:hypothetical protein